MVLRLGHFDNRRQRPHQLRHVGGGLARDERAALAEDQGGATAHRPQIFAKRLAETPPAHRRPVELPGPAALDGHQRMPGDELDDEIVLAGLRRHQAKARQGGIEARIDFLVAPIGRRERTAYLLFGRADGGIDDHGAAEFLAELRGELHRHETAEAVADDEGALPEAGIRDHRAHLCGADIRAIALAPAAVPHARQVDRRHAKIAGEIRRDEAPPIGVCAATVDEQQAAVDGSRRFGRPEQIMDRAIFYDDMPRLPRPREGPSEPFGGGRANFEITQWDRCIAQEKLPDDYGGGAIISLAIRMNVDAICQLAFADPLRLPATLEAPPARLRWRTGSSRIRSPARAARICISRFQP